MVASYKAFLLASPMEALYCAHDWVRATGVGPWEPTTGGVHKEKGRPCRSTSRPFNFNNLPAQLNRPRREQSFHQLKVFGKLDYALTDKGLEFMKHLTP